MFTQAALSRFQMDPLKDLQYIQLGSIGQGIPALKAGTIDALTTSTPHDLFAQRLGFKVSCPTDSEQLFAADKSEFLTVLC
jgi:ABC-type nitrate/sulfonate/bicarbonate transport system substrate-binding protein